MSRVHPHAALVAVRREPAERRGLSGFLLALALAACGDGSPVVAEAPSAPHIREPMMPALPVFVPQAYMGGAQPDPFDARRLMRQDSGRQPEPIAVRREREPLEAYPLAAIALVGSLSLADGRRLALLRADGYLHVAAVGTRIGLDEGRVTRIADAEIELAERVWQGDGSAQDRVLALRMGRETAP